MIPRRAFVLLASLVGLAAVATVVTGRLPIGPPDIDMVVPRNEVGLPVAPVPLLVGVVAAMLVVAVVAVRRRVPVAALLVALAAVTVVFDLGLHQPVPRSWSWRILTTVTLNPFFAEAGRDDDPGLLVGAHRRRLKAGYLSEHGDRRRLTTYPEGLVVGYSMVWRLVTECDPIRDAVRELGRVHPEIGAGVPATRSERVAAAAAVASVIHLIAVALLPVAAWWLANELVDDQAAVVAAALTALAPAPHLWVHDVNVLTAALPAAAAAALLWAARGCPPVAAVVGAVLAIGTFMTLALLPGIAAAGLLMLLSADRERGDRPFVTALSCVAGAVAAVVAAAVVGGPTVCSLMLALRNSRQFYEVVQRGHLSSVVVNAVELWVLFGAVATTAAVMVAGSSIAALFRDRWRVDRHRRAAVTIAAVVVAVACTGGVRGEIARSAMSLVPFFAVLAVTDPRLRERSATVLVGFAAVSSVLLCALMEPVLGFFTR